MAVDLHAGLSQAGEPWWPLVLGGLLSVAAGLVALKWPGITALALLLLIAYWSILRGILEIAAAVRLRHELQGEGRSVRKIAQALGMTKSTVARVLQEPDPR